MQVTCEDFTTLTVVYFVKVDPLFFSVKIALNLPVKDFSRNVACPQEMNQVERFIGTVLSKIHNQIIFLQRIKQPDFFRGPVH